MRALREFPGAAQIVTASAVLLVIVLIVLAGSPATAQ
jgi:hypothetical protein